MGDDRTVPIEKRPGYSSEFDIAPILGPLPLDLPEGAGMHVGQQCQTCTTLGAAHEAGAFVVLFLGKSVEPAFAGLGFYIALEPNQARNVAAGMISAADNLDQGKGKQ